MSKSICRLTPASGDEIAKIIREGHLLYPFAHGSKWLRAQIDSEFQVGFGWGLFLDNSLVCFAFFRDQDNIWELMNLACHPKEWKKGHSKFLLQSLMMKEMAGKSCWLEVHEENIPAIQLYTSLGFINVGRRECYYADGGAALLFSLNPGSP